MLFHVREQVKKTPTADGIELSHGGSSRGAARVNPLSVVWAILIISLLIGASFLAHLLGFIAGETVFLNLTVAVTSACAGAFIGEKLALGNS